MQNRRLFLKQATNGLGLAAFSPIFENAHLQSFLAQVENCKDKAIDSVVSDEDFWWSVRQAFTISPNLINLNNGGVSPQPKLVQEAVEHFNRLANDAPSHYMWRVLDGGREPLRQKLAELAGCNADEVAILRNTTEALSNIVFGLRLKAGDEVVLTKQDYPNMINAWKQRAQRDGIVLKWLDFKFPIEDNELIVKEFEKAFSEKTKVVHVTHMINWNGQLLPAKEIARAAHSRGIEVVLDAAHSFAQIDFKVSDLDCDYMGTSLHKWLCAPFGTGLMFVKKSKISRLYPLCGAGDPEIEDIHKFENLGTRSFAIEQAIGHAIDFHQMIGIERKQKRLFYLKKYWTERVGQFNGVNIATSASPSHSGAMALLQIEGKTAQEITEYFYGKYKLHTVAIDWENIKGVRISPNIYTTLKELDVLVAATKELAEKS